MSRANPYTYQSFVADYYDYLPPVAGRQDLDFYLEVDRTQGEPILELGCGTGRDLLHMAQAGLRAVGLDLSEPMLARCRAKLENQPAAVREPVRQVHDDTTGSQWRQSFSRLNIPLTH